MDADARHSAQTRLSSTSMPLDKRFGFTSLMCEVGGETARRKGQRAGADDKHTHTYTDTHDSNCGGRVASKMRTQTKVHTSAPQHITSRHECAGVCGEGGDAQRTHASTTDAQHTGQKRARHIVHDTPKRECHANSQSCTITHCITIFQILVCPTHIGYIYLHIWDTYANGTPAPLHTLSIRTCIQNASMQRGKMTSLSCQA